MKQKELKNLAKKIAKAEILLSQTALDAEEKRKAEDEIMKLSGKIKSIEDMVILDDLIQEYIEKLS